MTVTSTLLTPSVTEVTKTLVMNSTVVMPVTVTETRVVINNVTSTVVTTLPPVTIPVTHTVIQTVTETVTHVETVTHIENTVMYGGETFLNLLRNANKSIYIRTSVDRYVLDVIRAVGEAKA